MNNELSLSQRYIKALRQLPQYICVVSNDEHLTHALTGMKIYPVANAETLEIRHVSGQYVEVIAHLFFLFALKEAAEFEFQTSPNAFGISQSNLSPVQLRIDDFRKHLSRKHSLES